MRRRRNIYVLVGLLTAAILSIPRYISVQANESSLWSEEILSDNGIEAVGLSGNETGDSGESSISENIDEQDLTVKNETLILEEETTGMAPEDGTSGVASENGTDIRSDEDEPDLSENSLSADALDDEEILDTAEKREKEPLDVVLPTDVPFDIVLFGEEGFDALIKSDQYCIENRSDEDICISIRGVCKGEEGEDYAVAGSSVREDYVYGKKNIWICLQWEDEERKVLEQPGIMMGDPLDPGKGEIILRAPKKDKNGKIIGKNDGSKAYFSFTGDMKSDSGQIWKSGELGLKLDFSMEVIKGAEEYLDDNPNTAEEYSDDDPNTADKIQENMNLVNKDSELF